MSNVFFDTNGEAITTKRIIESNGFIKVTDCPLSRTGVFKYRASELGEVAKGYDPREILGVYRPESEVFNDEAMKSFEGCVVTDNHPPEMVNSKNSREYSRGHLVGNIRRIGDKLVADIKVTDDGTIRKINNGKQELSNGYSSKLIDEVGVSPDGEEYHFIQTAIRGNHVAIVDRGRAGSECRLSDAALEVFDGALKELDGKKYTASDFAYTPDAGNPDTWKLPILNMDYAEQALTALTDGIWGNKVDIPEQDLQSVKDKVCEALTGFGVPESTLSKLKDGYMTTTVKYIKDSVEIEVDLKDSPQETIDYVCYLNTQIEALTLAKEEALAQAKKEVECYERSVKEVEEATNRADLADAALVDSNTKLVQVEGEMSVLKDTIAELESKVLDGAALDTLISDRVALIDSVHTYYPTMDVKGLTNDQIKLKFVKERSTTIKDDNASVELVDAMFKEFTSVAPTSILRDRMAQAFAQTAGQGQHRLLDNSPESIINRYKK